MRYGLPAELQDHLEARLEGISRIGLRERAGRISLAYRGDGNSGTVAGPLDALAYAVVRMPGTFAAALAAAERVAEALPGFGPTSLLDAGAGPGPATWAAGTAWPTLTRATLLDQNDHLLRFAEDSMAADGDAPLRAEFRRASLPGGLADADAADLVVAAYLLTELPEPSAAATLDRLWALTRGVLLLVEPGTSAGFARLLGHRRRLLDAGAHLVAPCSHAGACPLAGPGADRWCHFAQRLPRSKDHRLVKGVEVPWEDEKYAYLALSREPLPGTAPLRVLATPKVNKGEVRLAVCTPDAPTERVVHRADKPGYKAAKRLAWGDALHDRGRGRGA